MSIRFRLLTEADVKAVLTMDDLIEAMGPALQAFSTGGVTQPVRTVIPLQGDHAFFGVMPAFVRPPATSSLGAKLVTVVGSNAERGLPSHLASILLLDPDTGALQALLDGRYITEARTAAVSAVSSRLLARKPAKSLAIIGSGVQARSHLEALSRIHSLRQVTVWSPQKLHRDAFVEEAKTAAYPTPYPTPSRTPPPTPYPTPSRTPPPTPYPTPGRTPPPTPYPTPGRTPSPTPHPTPGRTPDPTPHPTPGRTPDPTPTIIAVDHAGEAVVGADVIVLVTSSPTPVIEDGWVKPGAHVISVGACRPNQREMDPALVARARLFVDSRSAALVESGDVALGIQDGRFAADHIVAEIGELAAGATGRRSDSEVTIFKSLGLAVEDVTAAELAYRRAVERGIGMELAL